MDSGSVLFDRYRLEERIGAGGMGVVWLATDLLLDQPVALKRVSLAGVDDQQAELARQRALREARVAARLRHHRYVVATHDVRVEDGDVWLVLEYLPSRSLAQILGERGQLTPGEAARIGAQVADALAAAHAVGIEHRDVTPGNVLITEDGAVKLTDFGISRLADDAQLTQSGMISGTIAYMAPEVAKTGKSSPASDVFSLGSSLYTAIEGQPPFGTADNALQLLCIVGAGNIRPPRAAGALTPLLMRLLELDPAARPDAATARDRLDEFATQAHATTRNLHVPSPLPLPLPPPPTPPPPTPPQRWSPRRPVLAVALVLIILAVLAVGTTLALVNGSKGASAAGGAPISLTGDPRAADPCALIDLASLRQFGQPTITVSNFLEGCRARIATPSGDVHLNVLFANPSESLAALGGTPQQLGQLTISRKGTVAGAFGARCENVVVLTDRTEIHIGAIGSAPDLCAITEVGTTTAANALARDGISYRPDRNSGLLIAGSDACAVLDATALRRVAGLDPGIRFAGFAKWFCTWGVSRNGSPQVQLLFRLDGAKVFDLGDPTTIAGRRAWLATRAGVYNPEQCRAFVVYRPAPSDDAATEIVEIAVDAPGSREDLCARATELATAAVARLPASR